MKKLYKYLLLPLFAFCVWILQKDDKTFSSEKTSNKSSQTTTAKNNVLLPDSAAIRNIRNVIANREYHITYDDQTRSFQSPNRGQNLRATYEPGALTIRKRADSTHSGFTVKLLNQGIFAGDKLLYAVAPESAVAHSENKAVIDHGHFSEEFINNEEGIRQNFIIDDAPEGVKSLEVKLAVSGATVRDMGQNELHFITSAEGDLSNKLVYNGLKCWDADGKILDATLAYANNRIEINVAVENANFPVTIDPLTSTGPIGANKMLEIHQYYAWMGYAVSTAGDVNGDGYSDVIVGAPKYDNGQTDEGAAFLFPGSAAGVSL